MKKLFLPSFMVLLLIGCNDDEHWLSKEEILQNYYWEYVQGGSGRVVAVIGEPFPTLDLDMTPGVVTLNSDGYYGEVLPGGTGVCRNLGSWTLVDDNTLKLGGKTAVIKKLTYKEFIYTISGREIKRKGVKKPF